MLSFLLKRYSVLALACALLVVGGLAIVVIGSIPPSEFAAGTTVTVQKNATLSDAADALVEKGVIRSSFLFKAYASLLGGRTGIHAGSYLFDEPQSSLRVAYRMARGQLGLERIKVTIPEGSDARDIAWIMLKAIPGFDAPGFISIAAREEGRLFPDTYFFYEKTTPQEAVDAMTSLFGQKIAELQADIAASGRSQKEVLTMASILEREATTSEDRRMIAGILWKRIEIGMPLQVDAPFWYLFRKGTKDLSSDDLKVDSPYNTYRYKGLPPGPISNPGIDAISDALKPTSSRYLFYLSDKNGNMHYAETLEQHAANKRKYL